MREELSLIHPKKGNLKMKTTGKFFEAEQIVNLLQTMFKEVVR